MMLFKVRIGDNVSSQKLEFEFYSVKTTGEVINSVDYNRQIS